jgi:hypothetical protein
MIPKIHLVIQFTNRYLFHQSVSIEPKLKIDKTTDTKTQLRNDRRDEHNHGKAPAKYGLLEGKSNNVAKETTAEKINTTQYNRRYETWLSHLRIFDKPDWH